MYIRLFYNYLTIYPILKTIGIFYTQFNNQTRKMLYRKLRFDFKVLALLISALAFSDSAFADGGGFSSSSVHFNMDACSSFASLGTNSDYSEFTATIDNSASCLQMSVVGGNLYRNQPMTNPHSCTAGINGTDAMCVSSLIGCTYEAGHMRSVKMDILVSPGTDGTGSLSGLSFYEQAPEMFSWTQGATGLNNYPTQYGVRVLKDGAEIWRSEGNATTTGWTLESFNWLGLDDFTVSTATTFTIELLGYCVIGNGADVTAWDLDEITVESSCGEAISGGGLTFAGGVMNTSLCVGLGTSSPVNTVLTGAVGPNSIYLITELDGTILASPTAPPFDFEGAGTGACLIWHISYSGTITGLTAGQNASDITGCFDLSNAIRVDRFSANGGTLSTSSGTTLCAGGNNSIDVSLTGAVGTTRYVVTDLNGTIIGLPGNGSTIDLSPYTVNECLIYNVSYQGNINGLALGEPFSGINGTCVNSSNSIQVGKSIASGGVLSTNGVTFINLCEGNGASNIINAVVNGAQGANSQLVLTDASGNIIDANLSSPYDFTGSASQTYLIYNVSWNDNLNGLTNGGNINNLDGFCFGVSNFIEIEKERAAGGTIASSLGSDFEICIAGVISDPIDVSLSGADGEFSRWIITDDNGVIIGLPGNPPFQLDPTAGDVCNIWHLGFESSFQGLFLGQDVATFTGCFELSNNIRVTKRSSSAGRINANGGFTFIDVCGSGGSQVVNVGLFNNFGNNQTFVISDPNGMILSVGGGPDIDFSSFALGEYRINHVAYFSGAGPAVGGNINTLTGDCLDISNTMTINKYDPTGGTISTAGGSISVCGDGQNDMVDVSISGNRGGFNRWIVTDANGNIIGLPGNPPFNFEGYPEGTCLLYHISYENGIGGINVGTNVNTLTGCFSLSNSIEVTKQSITPGTLSLPDGTTTTGICLLDNESDLIDVVHSGANGPMGSYVITDGAGNILEVGGTPPFDLSNAGPGSCRIYFVSHDGITGLAAGASINDLDGCFAVTNFVTVNRDASNGGTITFDGGFTNTSVCVGEGNVDLINVTLTGSAAGNSDRWVITDESGTIIGLPGSSPFNFEGAGSGICTIYNVNYSGGISNLVMGGNISDLEGCFSLSNGITVERYTIDTSTSTSTLTYNMNACNAQNAGVGGADYSELTGNADNSSACTTLSGSTIYRNDPVNNPHSCTPGLNGSAAICVSSSNSCTFIANSNLALRFDVTVVPGPNGLGSLSSLSFYEAAPVNFSWINGTSGPNNYPTVYGIRVMKNGTEVFRQAGISTSFDFSLENFNFSNNPEFTVSEESVFSFELLGYCTAGVNSTISAWDIEDLVITSTCQGGLSGGDLTIASGGSAGGTTMTVCVDDGIDENITLNLLNAAGPVMNYLITDQDGIILALPASQPFNFEGTGAGTCLLWNLAYLPGLVGANVGASANDLAGCFSLSNPITVVRREGADCALPVVSGGTITTSNGLVASDFCVNDGESDMVEISSLGSVGTYNAWVITDADNVITAMPTAFPYDFEGSALGRAFVYQITYEGELNNMDLGNTLDMIDGHFAFSNAIIVDKTDCKVVVQQAERESLTEQVSDFKIFPNPANNFVTVQADKRSIAVSTVQVFDTFGQEVDTYRITDKEIKIDLEKYPVGYYFIKIQSGDNTFTNSFLKL